MDINCEISVTPQISNLILAQCLAQLLSDIHPIIFHFIFILSIQWLEQETFGVLFVIL